jgi:hypothetical protein
MLDFRASTDPSRVMPMGSIKARNMPPIGIIEGGRPGRSKTRITISH